jgi:DNA recombination protein RmuC
MLSEWLTPGLLALLLVITLWIALRRPPADAAGERSARELRDEVARSAQGTRQELGTTLADFQRILFAQQGEVARTQNEQIDAFGRQLAAMQQQLADSLGRATEAQAEQGRLVRESLDLRMTEVRATVEQKLVAIQSDNEKKLEQIRATVDEKLHATLEQRLGESFKLVAERLDTVHRGLNEMHAMAKDVGSLNRVLTNVKTRGNFGEWQLASLLEEVFTIEQYGKNVETVPGSGARVDFAIKMPGRGEAAGTLWLPIDAKFPREDYERLLDSQERGDAAGATSAGRAMEQRMRLEARSIRAKYVAEPHTTEFAILFVASEGLYAEALRRPGLAEALQREHRVMLAGPTTLLATLNSLQMGFRTLALERRSAEVWEVLGAVKTEFEKFGRVLSRVKDQARTVINTIDEAETRTRQMSKALKGVEAMPEESTQQLLPGLLADEEGDA